MAKKTRRRRMVRGAARARAPEAFEGVEAQSRKQSGIATKTGTGLVTRLGSSATSTRPDRVKPARPASPRTATDVERSDRRHRRTRAADPRDGANERARDVLDKGGDPDAAAADFH